MNNIEKLFKAVKKGKVKVVRELIAAGTPVNVAEETDEWCTLLHYAVRCESTEVAELLLAAGADLHTCTAHGYSPLHYAAGSYGSPEMCRFLLKAGAKVNFNVDRSATPLHRAAINDHPESCRVLIDHGADPSYVPEDPKPDYLTPFQAAVRYGSTEVVQMMVQEYGQRLDQTTVDGRSLMDVCCSVFMRECLLSLETELAISGVVDESAGAPLVKPKSPGKMAL